MQAIILAAGMGKRLRELTSDNTKCMVKVNGESIIDRLLHQLNSCGITKIVIVVGYKADNLRQYIRSNHPDANVTFIENPVYDKTNNIYSLWLAKDYLTSDDTLLLESDLVFEESVLRLAIDSPWPDCALIARYETWMDGTMVRVDEEGNIVNFISKEAFSYDDIRHYFKTVNIYKFSREFSADHYLPFLEAYLKVLGENEYYEQVLRVITLIEGCNLKGIDVGNRRWYEIDDVQDLRIAETIFASPKEKLRKLREAGGGYWRYPRLRDFSSARNPYFPPRRMLDEMAANFPVLLKRQPSGSDIINMLTAKMLDVPADTVATAADIEVLNSGIFDALGDGQFTEAEVSTIDFREEYGVPGLRLCAAVSSDRALIAQLRSYAGLHPVDSFAEFFLQIFGKYEKRFHDSCLKIEALRREVEKALANIPGVTVLPSDSLYADCLIPETIGATEVAERLLARYDILVAEGGNGDNRLIRIALSPDSLEAAKALEEVLTDHD